MSKEAPERTRRTGRSVRGMDTAAPLEPKIVLEFLGAAAGIAAFITFVGGAALWIRFSELGLPADRVVALLPTSMLVTVGAHALIVPAIAGLGAVITLYAFAGRSQAVFDFAAFVTVFAAVLLLAHIRLDLELGWELWVVLGVAAVVAIPSAAAFHGLCAQFLDTEERAVILTMVVLVLGLAPLATLVSGLPVVPHLLIVVVVTIAGAGAILATAASNLGNRPVLWIVFLSFLLVGAAVSLTRTANEPKLEPVAVLLKDPDDQIAGFYVGESDGRLHVAQLRHGSGIVDVSAEPVEEVVSVSRDRVARMALREPAGLGPRDEGREQAETMMEQLVLERRIASGDPPPPAEPVDTDDPVETFAPLVSIHADEPVSPTSADYFLERSDLLWSYSGNCPARRVSDLGDRASWAGLGKGDFKARRECGDQGLEYTTRQYTRPHGKGRVRRKPPRAELKGREGFYLDLEDRARKPKPKHTTEGTQHVLGGVPVYYERHPEDETAADDLRITYWFFYPFSIPPGGNDKVSHEGDWERISVLVEQQDDERWRPLSVRFHEHDTHVDVPWADVRTAPGADGLPTHPRAYTAKGSHATYRRAGKFVQVLARGRTTIVRVEDEAIACPECPLWFTWRELVDAQKEPWYGYGGAWGEVASESSFSGPLGPSLYKTRGLSDAPEQTLQQAESAGRVPLRAAPAATPSEAAPGTEPPADSGG